MPMQSINPYDGSILAEFNEWEDTSILHTLEQMEKQNLYWKSKSLVSRCDLVEKIAKKLIEHKEKYALLITQETGKLYKESLAEIEKCAWVCNYYAQNAEHFLKQKNYASDASKSFVRFEPMGGILAIMPWNFPFWQVFRALVPIIIAGNSFILKHASNVMGCALAIEELVLEAGLPENVIRSLVITSHKVEKVIQHNSIKGITLTGSETTGKIVAGIAGKHLKKCVLELGGSDPFIILNNTDLNHTINQAIYSRLINAGQSCIAAKRFIVVEAIADNFIKKLTEKIKNYQFGDPMSNNTQIAPLARADIRVNLHNQIQTSIHQGAQLVIGGNNIDNSYSGYQISILDNIQAHMNIFQEETFGPIFSIIRVNTISEAIHLANQCSYGLGASIWSNDIVLAEDIANKIESGMVFINEVVKSDPRLPFGGIKDSGYGRELAEEGIREFTNLKTFYIK